MTPQNRVYFEWTRLAAMDEWWQYAALTAVIALIISYVVYLYRRDWVELPRGIGLALLLLRLAAFTGLLLYFFNLQKRSEQPIVRASRVAVVVDSSLSMTLPAGDAASESGADSATIATSPDFPSESRIDQIVRQFKSSPLLEQLTADHDVTVYRVDASDRPAAVASFKKKNLVAGMVELQQGDTAWTWAAIRWTIWAGTCILIASTLVLCATILWRLRTNHLRLRGFSHGISHEGSPDRLAYITLAAVILLITGAVLVGTAAMRGAQYKFTDLWNVAEPTTQGSNQDAAESPASSDVQEIAPESIDWTSVLAAQGSETRLGDAIRSILAREQNSPLAGILLLTDGQSNEGLSLDSAAGQAAAQGIPLHLVGLGSALDPVNARLVNVDAPRRVFPGDSFKIAATVQATGLEGKTVNIQLRRRGGAAEASDSNFSIEQEMPLELAAADQMSMLEFEVDPPAIGNYTYDVKILSPSQDVNSDDDSEETDVEVIEPKATVLVFAGGPTREYQFVRNLLFRDGTIQSHVLLQTGSPGISQEADKLLEEFPVTPQEMSQYDCVLCFDADFTKLSNESASVLENWVSSGAGGLVIIAGPVCTPDWTGSGANTSLVSATLRNMSPVVLNSQASRLASIGRFEGETVWPLRLTNETFSADFMDIANSREISLDAWDDFTGVYSYYSAYELKPGATPIAYFSDPSSSVSSDLPVYLATHFYGGGRVVFQGSGEMWRIRELDEDYFNTYWTKLVRWSAQGRLLRDSDYGLLLTDKEEAMLGDQVSVRAVLRDNQFRPLSEPSVTLNVVEPNGRLTPLKLNRLQGTGQEGVYSGQILMRQTGKYQLRLESKAGDAAVLTALINSRVPTREIERPKRNDPAMIAASKRTGGSYFAGIQNALEGKPFPGTASSPDVTANAETAAVPQTASETLSALVVPQDQVNFLPGAPDRTFQERWMSVLMLTIAGALSLEWLLRRLSRLA